MWKCNTWRKKGDYCFMYFFMYYFEKHHTLIHILDFFISSLELKLEQCWSHASSFTVLVKSFDALLSFKRTGNIALWFLHLVCIHLYLLHFFKIIPTFPPHPSITNSKTEMTIQKIWSLPLDDICLNFYVYGHSQFSVCLDSKPSQISNRNNPVHLILNSSASALPATTAVLSPYCHVRNHRQLLIYGKAQWVVSLFSTLSISHTLYTFCDPSHPLLC